MKIEKRYLYSQIECDLNRKMVFMGGPRQVGKTTLSKQFLNKDKTGYLNWDNTLHREMILNHELPNTKLWLFDEIHKYSRWREFVKGLYDTHGQDHQIMVTGSARLDFYRHGGDSLQGRYHYLRLHPLSLAELGIESIDDFLSLLKLGGFPEPFLSSSEIEAKRWSREYRKRLIEEEVRSLENVKDLGLLELMMLRLPSLVGSPLSINALREDLQVSHKAVSHWLSIFERLYAIFLVPPFGAPTIRAVKKEQKHYHYDWSVVKEKGHQFENLVASHLLKWVHYLQDTKGRDIELRYFRDTDRREVDFILVEDGQPIKAIECKWNDGEISRSLKYFKSKFPVCEAWQISAIGKKNYLSKESIKVCPAIHLLSTLV